MNGLAGGEILRHYVRSETYFSECAMPVADEAFFQRADAHIELSNAQLSGAGGPDVAASMSWGTARFNTWLCANMMGSKAEMARRRDEAIAQLTEHYTQQLRAHFDNYIEEFDTYMRPGTITRPPQG